MKCSNFDYNWERADYNNSANEFIPFIELKKLEADGPTPMNRIEWWLLKYGDDYKKIKEWEYATHDLQQPETFKVFVKIYELLDELAQINRKEILFKEAVSEYYDIKNTKEGRLKWVIKNENLADNDYCFISVEYLSDDYEGLKVRTHYQESPIVKIQEKDFQYLLEFNDIFDELYWHQEIYKEGRLYQNYKKEYLDRDPDTLIDISDLLD